MLLFVSVVLTSSYTDMRLKKISRKSRAVLKALAQGQSCEEILAADQTLTSHDVFRALSESPTSFWIRKPEPDCQSEGGSLS